MTSGSIGYANTARTLASLSQQRATGELTLMSGMQRWRLYFFHGRLVYGTGNFHRVRRWYRAIRQHCPNFSTPQMPQAEPWEYQLLSHSITNSQLNVNQARAVIKTSLEEVLFSWVSNPALTISWNTEQRLSLGDNSALSLLLSSPQVEKVLQRSQEIWSQWRNLELEALSPYKSPVLRRDMSETTAAIAPPVPSNLSPLLTGRHTLWDISSYLRRPVTTVTRFLLPWVQQGAITLEEIPDLPSPSSQSRPATAINSQHAKPLIACIDDSPTVGQVLASMLIPAGYRVINIQEPLAGIATLIKYKPDLILLDLVMPDTSGYNLCHFLRRTPVFQNTPIIILTSQDGLLDRTRAKLVGANDFLSKPPNPQALVSMIQSHLRAAATSSQVVQPVALELE
jgi:chemotaxis family two-component system response regulator PixG